MPETLFAKIWNEHVVLDECRSNYTRRRNELERHEPGAPALLYVDLHLVHEVTSPQAFAGLRARGRRVRRPEATIATADHNVPTTDRTLPIADAVAHEQLEALRRNTSEFGITYHDATSPGQGIVHVIGPEQGYTQPGMTIVCGDSHTSTHGAFGALAFGIGTSDVEHVLATQCVRWPRPLGMELRIDGMLAPGITAKDLALAVIARIGVDGGRGHVAEYRGAAVERLSMEGRMTLCNMSIEAGARAGLVAADEKTFSYLRGRPHAPPPDRWERAVARWSRYRTDPGAAFDRTVSFDASTVAPMVTWGTTPAMAAPVTATVPDPAALGDEAARAAAERALAYMDLVPGTPIEAIRLDRVFIGSCTNARIEDLRAAARVVRGRRVAPGIHALVVPGSTAVKRQAEAEGIARVFVEAGFEWREAGCSMCLGMNPDRLGAGERCAATSNRNFEGRQGRGGRTHLVSPPMAAAAALAGHFVDVRQLAAAKVVT